MAGSGVRLGIDLPAYAKWYIKSDHFKKIKKEDEKPFAEILKTKSLIQKPISVGDKIIHAYELRQPPKSSQKAIFYFPSYRQPMSKSVLMLEDLMGELTRQAGALDLSVSYTGYIPEYYFEGSTLKEDAVAAMECIRQCTMFEQYQTDDIILVGDEMGANLIVWAKHLLIEKDPRYHQLKLISFHAINNALENGMAKTVINDQLLAHKTLAESGWMHSSKFSELAQAQANHLFFHIDKHQISNGELLSSIDTFPISLVKTLRESDPTIAYAWQAKRVTGHFYHATVLKEANISALMIMAALIYQQPIKKPEDQKTGLFKSSIEKESIARINEYIASLSSNHARLGKSNSN